MYPYLLSIFGWLSHWNVFNPGYMTGKPLSHQDSHTVFNLHATWGIRKQATIMIKIPTPLFGSPCTWDIDRQATIMISIFSCHILILCNPGYTTGKPFIGSRFLTLQFKFYGDPGVYGTGKPLSWTKILMPQFRSLCDLNIDNWAMMNCWQYLNSTSSFSSSDYHSFHSIIIHHHISNAISTVRIMSLSYKCCLFSWHSALHNNAVKESEYQLRAWTQHNEGISYFFHTYSKSHYMQDEPPEHFVTV